MNAKQLLTRLGQTCYDLDGEMCGEDEQEFIDSFKNLSSCSQARDLRGIVYVWYTTKPIPRLKGESNVVYIGKTKSTFRERHHRYAAVEGSGYNWKRYSHIIKKFGDIRVACAKVENPRGSEIELLRQYKEEHLELPPINASG